MGPVTLKMPSLLKKYQLSPVRITAIYALTGGLWIVFSDTLLAALVKDPAVITRISIYKGWSFVVVTAGLLFWLLRIDLTARKKAEEALQRSEQVLRLFVEHAPAAIAMFDREMKYIAASRRFVMDYGLGGRNIIGRSHYEVFPDIPGRWKEIHQRCLAGSVEKSEEDPFPRADGKMDWVRWEIRPWYETQGKTGGLILFSEVITERKHTEQELEKHREHLEELVEERTATLNASQRALTNIVEDLNRKTIELEQANLRLKEIDQLKSLFIASMSHELRTPLNSVIGFSNVLLNQWAGPVNDEQKDLLATIARSGKLLLSLINDVIDVSKIETGSIEVQVEDFDLHDVVAEVMELMKKEISDKKLELNVDSIHLRMHTDRRRLLQSVLNLLSNAVKFTRKGSVSIRTRLFSGFVVLSVEDTGIGIKEEDLPKLFHSFVRLDSPLRTTVLGTGLGLYLTKKLVTEILKGDLVVESEFEAGSRFSISVPVKIDGSML